MKHFYLIYWFIIFVGLGVCCMGCCKNNDTKSVVYCQLETVDSLFHTNNDSLAVAGLEKIPQPSDSTYELAYYLYLTAKKSCRYYDTIPPNILDYPISIFENNCDTLKLCYAYTYKALSLLKVGCKDSARFYNNKAEALLGSVDDYILKCNVYIVGYQIGLYYYDGSYCIHYALKALEQAELHNDKKRIAYASHILALCYNEQGNIDEAEKYVNKCVNYIDCFDTNGQAAVYSHLGEIAEHKGQLLLAEQYYLKSTSIAYYYASYTNLTKLYFRQGRIADAEKYYQKSLLATAYSTNAEIMLLYADALKDNGNFREAVNIYKGALAQKDSLIAEMGFKNEELEAKNVEKKVVKELIAKTNYYPLIIAITFVVLSALLFVCIYANILKTKTKNMKIGIAQKNADIERISAENVLLSAKIEHFQNLLNMQKSEIEEIYCVGQKLYTDIVCGRSITKWSSKDENNFIEYYKLIDFKFVNKLENEYDNLSDHNKVFLILEMIESDRSKRLQILGIAESSYRSAKSRIEGMRK